MTKSISLDALWDSATPTELVFNSDKLSHLPAAAKPYLEHAIAPGTKIASAVRLKMHGEIKLKKWIPLPFRHLALFCWSGDRPRSQSLDGRLDSAGNADRLVCHFRWTVSDVCYKALPAGCSQHHCSVSAGTRSSGGRDLSDLQSLCKNKIVKYKSVIAT